MRQRIVIALLSVSLLPSIAGCGTITNMAGHSTPKLIAVPTVEPVPFGGVGRDIWWITEAGFWGIFIIPDIPLSLVGDLITLNKTLEHRNPDEHWASFMNLPNEEEIVRKRREIIEQWLAEEEPTENVSPVSSSVETFDRE